RRRRAAARARAREPHQERARSGAARQRRRRHRRARGRRSRDPRLRRRRRHQPRGAPQPVRAVLHHQAGRQRRRAGAGAADRGRARRHDHRRAQPGRRYAHARDHPRRGARPSLSRGGMTPTPPTVLVADDNRAVLQALTLLFSEDGWRVLTAESPSALLARTAAEPPDVIVLDMNFQRDTTSGQEGIDLIRQLHQAWPELPVVLMTAWATVERAVEAMQLGARDYVRKPWDNDRLLAACRTQLALRRARVPSASDEPAGDELGRSPAMRAVMQMVRAIAPTEASVLLVGEPGTGKELVARALHQGSRRRNGPFVKVNMGALPDALVERELFGHVRGAFTDAGEDRPGRFAAAAGGTILLDEIG